MEVWDSFFAALAGTALASVDTDMSAAKAPGPYNGFNQSSSPTAAPPVPASVAQGAAKFQQTVTTFGRRLQYTASDKGFDDAANASGEHFGRAGAPLSHVQLQQELEQHEAQLRDILADQQHL